MAPASVSYGLALLNYVRSGIVARVRGKDVSGEGVGGEGGRRKEGMRDGRLVTRRSDLWMARASLCLARGQQRGTPGARNRSQINVARQVSSRFFSPRRRSRIRTIYRAVRFDHFSLSLFPRSWKQKCQRILFHGFRFLSFPFFLYFLFPRDRDIRRIIPASRNHRSRDSIFSFFFQYPVEFLALRGSISNALFPLFFFSRENLSGRGSSHTFHVSTGPDVQIRST